MAVDRGKRGHGGGRVNAAEGLRGWWRGVFPRPVAWRVEEGSTVPLRPALRSTAFGGDRPGLASEGPPFLQEGGRGVHDPAPASASLYRLWRQTVLRGTVDPSSRRLVWGPMDALRAMGAGREEYSHHPPPARSAWAERVPIPTHPQKPPQRAGASVRFYRAVGEARDNGPPEERSKGK